MSREDFELLVETVSAGATLVLLIVGVWAAIHFGRAAKKQELLDGHERDLAAFMRIVTPTLNAALEAGLQVGWRLLRVPPTPPKHHHQAIRKAPRGQHNFALACAYVAGGQVVSVLVDYSTAVGPREAIALATDAFGLPAVTQSEEIVGDAEFAVRFGRGFIAWAYRIG